VLAFTSIWGFIILLRGLVPAADEHAEPGETFQVHWGEFAVVIVLVTAYALLLEPLGFEIATFAFLLVLLVPRLISWTPSWIAFAFGAAALATLILWATFGLALKVQLPLKFLPLFFY